MKIDNLKTKEDILEFMKANIKYGWIDKYGIYHINTMDNFRQNYITNSIEDTLKSRLGTCIEQVNLMNYLCKIIGLESKMYVTRIYEDESKKNSEGKVYMHCFLLVLQNDKIYHIEHPNFEKVGIYEYKTLEEAKTLINKYYIGKSGGISRTITEIEEVPVGLSFNEFNIYINNLDNVLNNML